MASQNFAAQVGQWTLRTKQRTQAVFQTAVQNLAEDVTEPGPSMAGTKKAISKGVGKGRGKSKRQGPVKSGGAGHLPVDTGFLWHSFQISSTQMPAIDEGAQPKEGSSYSFSISSVAPKIAALEIGQTAYMGFTAAYARSVEYGNGSFPGYGFVRLAAQNWQKHVADAVREVRNATKAAVR